MSNSLLSILIAVLASYRIARMITLESGPFHVFHKIRAQMGAYDYDAQGNQSALGELFSCPLCMGVYVSLLIAPTLLIDLIIVDFVLLILAIAGAQTYLQKTER